MPILRLYGTHRQLIPRITTSDESHFGQKRQFFVGAKGGRISSRFPPLQLRWFAFPILRFYATFETNFPNRHFRWAAFWPKRRFFASANDGRISVLFSHTTITRRVSIFQFYGLRDFRKLIFRITTSDESHFDQKRQFCAIAYGGRISDRFSPTTITVGSRFANFTALRNFLETNSPNHHFR